MDSILSRDDGYGFKTLAEIKGIEMVGMDLGIDPTYERRMYIDTDKLLEVRAGDHKLMKCGEYEFMVTILEVMKMKNGLTRIYFER